MASSYWALKAVYDLVAELGGAPWPGSTTGVRFMAVPDGGKAARPFLPTKEFEQSQRFYEAHIFKKLLDIDVAYPQWVRAGFTPKLLQAGVGYKSTMFNDRSGCLGRHIAALNLKTVFGVRTPSPPEMQA